MDVVVILTSDRILEGRILVVFIEHHQCGVELILNCRICVEDPGLAVDIAAHEEIDTDQYRWDRSHID